MHHLPSKAVYCELKFHFRGVVILTTMIANHAFLNGKNGSSGYAGKAYTNVHPPTPLRDNPLNP